MHANPIDEDHASALHVAALFSSRCGMLIQFESTCVDVFEADNLEIMPAYGSGDSRYRLV